MTIPVVRAAARLAVRAVAPSGVAFGERASLLDHLEELRQRMFVCVAALAVAFGCCYAVHGRIVQVLTRLLPPGAGQPVTFGVAEPFLLSLRVSLLAAVVVCLPLVLWQLWGFVAPAVDPHAARAAGWFTLAGSALLVTGLAFGYLVALPAALRFLVGFDHHLYHVQLRAREYYDFVALSLLAIALVFELPILLLGLVRFGLLSSRTLAGNRRMGYAGVAVLAVLLPGVDPVLTTMEALPLAVLYEGTIVAARLLERRWARARIACEDGERGDMADMAAAA